MKFDVRHIVGAALSLSFLSLIHQPVAAEDVPLIVDFRDGTVIRMVIPDGQIPWRRISEDGEVTEEPVMLSKVKQVRFVLTPATEQVAHVRRLIAGLGAARFQDREAAQAELIKRGAKFRTIIEQAVPRTKDYEVGWRLNEVIKSLPKEAGGLLGNDYDQLTLNADEEQEIHGDVGDWEVTTGYRGANIKIDRSNVLSVRNDTIKLDLLAEPPVVSMERIPSDEDELFPPDVTRIDFDRAPGGATIAAGTDISEVYVPVGATFISSYKDSFVAVEPYNVGGRSGGRCAANHKPLYQGTMTIRFCKPDNARLPAGVTHVGFWTSHIAPEGTALQAFDARGRQIGEIKTVRSQRDFLAMKTNVPIAYIRIVPDEEVDPDYAIDDLVFDTPKPLSEAGDPDRYSIVLATGERLHGSSLEVVKDTLVLKEVTVGIDELRIPMSELAILVPPRSPLPEVGDDQRCFLRMSDGSVLRARNDKGLKLVRFQDDEIDANRLVALWGAATILEEPPAEAWPKQGALMIAGNDEFVPIPDWKLGKTWIDSNVEAPGGEALTYANSPVVWFRQPGKRPEESGLLRTASGEEIVLGTDDGFALKQWSLEGVVIARGDSEWSIGMGEIRSLLLPRTKQE